MNTTETYGLELGFNPAVPSFMHIDLNSCFASIEQQANPHLRGRPVAVCAYTTPSGCILAASVEAKQMGVKTGMRVKDGKALCPGLVVLGSDPWKYRDAHTKIRRVLDSYTNEVVPKSIDEYVLQLRGYPAFESGMEALGLEIKRRIKDEVGDWLRVSIGIGANRFLAKTASDLRKPDGLETISVANYVSVYETLGLTDLYGIAERNAARLYGVGINSVLDFYEAPLWQLKAAFKSVNAYYWYLRLRGWDIDTVEFSRKSFGNQYALPKPYATEKELAPILNKLVDKTCGRLRRHGYVAQGVHLYVAYQDHSSWHKGEKTLRALFDTRDVFAEIMRLFRMSRVPKPARLVAVSVFNLQKQGRYQLDLFGQVDRSLRITQAVDEVNALYGHYTLTSARMLGSGKAVPETIGFGNLDEF